LKKYGKSAKSVWRVGYQQSEVGKICWKRMFYDASERHQSPWHTREKWQKYYLLSFSTTLFNCIHKHNI